MRRLLCWWFGHDRWEVEIDHGYVGSHPPRFIEKAVACRRCGKILDQLKPVKPELAELKREFKRHLARPVAPERTAGNGRRKHK